MNNDDITRQDHRDEFIIASTESGLQLCYNEEEFTVDSDMERKLLMFFARHRQEMFSEIVCPKCDSVIVDKTLKYLRAYIGTHHQDGSCPIDSMNEGTCHDYEFCELCIFDHAVAELKEHV